jgi:hypothetical protein
MDLIIKIRLEALKNNLTKIQCILKSVKDRRGEIDKLSVNLSQAQQHLDDVGYNVRYLLDTSRNKYAKAKMDPSFPPFLELAETEVGKLSQALQNVQKGIEAIQTRWTPIEKSFEETLKEDLNDTIGPWLDKIAESIKALSAAQPGEINQLMEKAWRDYNEIMSEQSQLIFSDYVEFLGGLALRDAGLDEGICRIADELIRSCGSVGRTQWSALTIPASQEAVTLAASIRMRFPEWTIWAVPLTAHELGEVVIKDNPNLEKDILTHYPGSEKKTKKNRHHMRVYLNDAFATYVMGPAYACAAILLRFNPRAAYQDKIKNPADAKRAHVVLSMLRKMFEFKEDPNVVPPYGDILEKLKAGWDAALAQTQTQPPPATLNPDLEILEQWTDHLLAELNRAYANSLYQGRLWTSTREALELLLSDEDPGDKLKGNEEWKDVLNAAWACRVNNVDDSQKIAKKAEELWQRIVQKKSETQGSRVSPSGFAANIVPRIQGDKKS